MLWMIAGIGFVAAGIGLLTHHAWWRTLAVISAAVSLPVTVLFLGGVAASNKVAALIVDIAILVGLLWPPVELAGS